jgi:acyl-CoA synthetase (AMP-forming)/AMP-acid ligase II
MAMSSLHERSAAAPGAPAAPDGPAAPAATVPAAPDAPDGPAAPDGPGLVAWLTEAAAGQVMTDGSHTVAHGELGRLLARLDERFARAGLTGDHPVALECGQGVAGALAILQALRRQLDVVLLPELAGSSKEAGTPRFIPSFCSHVITARAAAAAPGAAPGEDPLAAIAVAAHADFTAEPAIAGFAGPDFYLRTSGSTGGPKLARMSHRKWLRNAMACVERWGLAAGDRLAIPVPIFHAYGFGAGLLPGLLAGAAIDLGAGGHIVRYLEREASFAPTVAMLTPGMCEAFVTVRKAPRPYRLVVTAGDKIKPETVAAFEPRFGPLLNLYGSSEMGAASSPAPADPAACRLGTVGYPHAGVELSVDESDPGEGPAGPGAGAAAVTGAGAGGGDGARRGRLLFRSPNGFAGYLSQQPDGWRFAPRADGEWFVTGDLARLRADGYVEILGRSAMSVKRDGLLVVFAEVEAALERIAGIQRAVVVAAGESRRGSRLVAVCLKDEQAGDLLPAAVRRRCGKLVPRYAVPDEVVFVDTLPQLASGKLDRGAVRDLVAGPRGS